MENKTNLTDCNQYQMTIHNPKHNESLMWCLNLFHIVMTTLFCWIWHWCAMSPKDYESTNIQPSDKRVKGREKNVDKGLKLLQRWYANWLEFSWLLWHIQFFYSQCFKYGSRSHKVFSRVVWRCSVFFLLCQDDAFVCVRVPKGVERWDVSCSTQIRGRQWFLSRGSASWVCCWPDQLAVCLAGVWHIITKGYGQTGDCTVLINPPIWLDLYLPPPSQPNGASQQPILRNATRKYDPSGRSHATSLRCGARLTVFLSSGLTLQTFCMPMHTSAVCNVGCVMLIFSMSRCDETSAEFILHEQYGKIEMRSA